MFYPDDRPLKEWRSLINPGISIPPAATAIHGITDADVFGRPLFKQIAVSLAGGFTDCDYAGKNVRFDLRVLAAEFARAKVAWSYAGARIIDADRLEALAHPRDLASLHEKYVGLKHDGAHGALADVRASVTVLVKQLEAHATLPRDLDQLHNLSWPGWISLDGGIRFIDGVATMCFGKHRGKPMKDVPRDYWDFVLSSSTDFGPDMKALAAKAKMGEFPNEQIS
jgi:DNA polymerase-3 subunit epsilon